MQAIVLLACCYLLIFYCSYIHTIFLLKKNGILINNIFKMIKSKNIKNIEIILKILILIVSIIQLISIFSIVRDYPISIAIKILGLILSGSGVIFFVMALQSMGSNWRSGFRIDDRVKLVNDGVYKYSRNPAFLGIDLLYLGLALTFPNKYIIAISIIVVVLFHIEIINEEKYLISMFGKEYSTYSKNVGRYI